MAIWLMIVSLAGLAAYLPTFFSLAVSYAGGDSYYAHWFLIPPVSALFIWLKKDKFRQFPIEGWGGGLPLAAGSLLMHVFAVWFRIDFVSAFSFVATICGLALYLLGKRLVREISFPLFFLLFMVPIPELIIGPLAFHMRILSGKLAVSFYGLFGGTATLSGSSIAFPDTEPLWMGYECSGLRSLIALAALGAAFAHLARVSRPRKVALFLSSIPLAVLSNAVRVTSLCLAASWWGVNTKSFKVFHDASSPAVFIIVLVGLFGVHKLISIGDRARGMESGQADKPEAMSRAEPILTVIPRKRLRTAFGFLVGSAVVVFLSPHSLTSTKWMSSLKPVELPDRIGAWQKTNTEVFGNARLWSLLNTRSVVLSTYRDPEGREIQVLIVASDTHRNAFHPPELCMMGAGDEIVKSWKEPIDVDSRRARGFYLNVFVLRGRQPPCTVVLYWFMVGEKSMGSRLLQHLILLLNGARRTPIIGSMIRVTAPLATMSQQEALDSAKDLIRSLVPLMPRLLEVARGQRSESGG